MAIENENLGEEKIYFEDDFNENESEEPYDFKTLLAMHNAEFESKIEEYLKRDSEILDEIYHKMESELALKA